MKVLIVGSGGREHAIAMAVAKSPRVDKIYCAPGNAGIAAQAECVPIGAMEFDKLIVSICPPASPDIAAFFVFRPAMCSSNCFKYTFFCPEINI